MLSPASPQASIWLQIALVFSPSVSLLSTPTAHALQIRTASWLAIWLICVSRVGIGRPLRIEGEAAQAGLLLALGHACERVAGQSDTDWVKALLPFALHLLSDGSASAALTSLLSCSALVCTYHLGGRNPETILGLLYAAILPIALRQILKASERTESRIILLRDISFVASAVCLPLAVAWEPWRLTGLSYDRTLGSYLGSYILLGQPMIVAIAACIGSAAQIVSNGLTVDLVRSQSAFSVALLLAAGSVLTQLVLHFDMLRICSASIFTVCLASICQEKPRSRLLMITVLLSIIVLTMPFLQEHDKSYSIYSTPSSTRSPEQAYAPIQMADETHPISHLLATAQIEWDAKVARQSTTLESAVQEYRRRYGLWPPPNFDKWYDYAVSRNVRLIDEYDSIHSSLLPFWGLSPALIRARLQQTIGDRENGLIALLIRDKEAVHIEGGKTWQQQATIGMVERFVEHLPDMDVALNIYDEPRVVVPHDGLSRLIKQGQQAIVETAQRPANNFSPRSVDMSSGDRVPEVKVSRFNSFAHQRAWGPSKLSCPPDSPARLYDELYPVDNLTAYALSIGFIYNQTAFSDICNSPSLANSHGFFERPNAFSVTHDLVPIFSQSKMSSFQDILYPSPWYWFEKVRYSVADDLDWTEKKDQLYWRGTTTGGFARDGGWRRQHRQHIVRKLIAQDEAETLDGTVSRAEYADLINVTFTRVGQCDPLDCKAQKEFFTLTPNAEQQDAWHYRYLLDMDGNAFSGRFYAFLQSRSLTFKMAVFREWHEDWIAPWVHYIPLSLRGNEILEAVRWFSKEQNEAQRIAEASSKWAADSLRDDDLEVYFFRLLLEYGRLLDDDRQSIGYGIG